MSIKKSLLAVTAAALATMVFASSAMAVNEDKLVDVSTGAVIPENRELHLVGWAAFEDHSGNGMRCHVTSVIKVTGNTGKTAHVRTFTVPDTTKCTGTGAFSFGNCNELVSHSTTTTNALGVHDWDITATENDADVSKPAGTGEMVLHLKPKGTCFLQNQEVTLTFPSITLNPLKTGNTGTGTGNLDKLGGTALTGEPIAGVEISGTGKADILGGLTITATGELELTSPDICTWKFAA